jgi:hypothetical protein
MSTATLGILILGRPLSDAEKQRTAAASGHFSRFK